MALTVPARTIDYTHFAEVEATYGDITATPAAGDAFRCRARNLGFKSSTGRLLRNQDSDRSASIHTVLAGRRSSTWEIPAALAPSGVTGTPTACDMGEFFRAHFGTEDVGVGHSTCTSGSTTTVIAGTAGATAALGAVVGDFVGAVTTAGIEYRQITSIATDALTVTPALTSAPANLSALYATVTYKLSKSTLLSMILYGYLNGDFEHLCAGAAVSDMEITYDLGSDTPEPLVKFSGPAARVETLATSIPTPTLQTLRGIGPQSAYIWIGGVKYCMSKLALKSNNGMELRNNESCFMYPTGVMRTGNDGRYKIALEATLPLVGSAAEGFFDNARTLTAYDVTVQIGNTLGNSVAFRCPNWVPDVEETDVDMEVALALKGDVLGSGTDDSEVTLCMG